MADITALSQITNSAQALSGLILVSPQKTIGYQPQNLPAMDGNPTKPSPTLLFHYEGDQSVHLQSDITDHYVEDNTARQDQIALRPEEISTHGFIGELNDVAPPILNIVQAAANKLTSIGGYLPTLSETALLAYNNAFQLYQVALSAANSAVSAWQSVTGLFGSTDGGESVIGSNGITIQSNQTKQQVMFQQFYGYWRKRTLFTVQTPWAVFQNMAIKDLIAVQDSTTNAITDFGVTFKMIRTASTQISKFDPSTLQGRASGQSTNLVNNGVNSPVSSVGLLSRLPALGVE